MMYEELAREWQALETEQKRLIEVEDALRTMRSIAIEATTSDEKRRLHLDDQFQALQFHLARLEREKHEPFRQNTENCSDPIRYSM